MGVPPLTCRGSRAAVVEIQFFNLRSRPGRPAEKLQTGFDAGVKIEAANVDAPAEFRPAVVS